MRFILGPPCSGKGTITGKIKHIPSFSAGNILREMCNTEKYMYLAEILNRGDLVATDLICDILFEKASQYDYQVMIDGFPRTLEQAIYTKKILDDRNIKCNGVFYLKAPMHLLIHRTLTRTYCEQCYNTHFEPGLCCEHDMIRRKDDNIETLIKRLDIFEQNINKILEVLEGPIYIIHNDGDVDNTMKTIFKYL